MQGLILFAHGARDPRWAEPLLRLRERLAARAPAARVAVAYLEIMAPDLPRAAGELVDAGCDALTIVPVFLGQGGHVRRDLAALLVRLVDAHPGVTIDCAAAVGEDDAVLDAIAGYCVRALAGGDAGPRKA